MILDLSSCIGQFVWGMQLNQSGRLSFDNFMYNSDSIFGIQFASATDKEIVDLSLKVIAIY